MHKLIDFFKDEDGAELVEWTAFVALLVISIVTVVTILRAEIITAWGAIKALLDSANGT